MPGCPRCKSFYPDGTTICPADGARLVDEAILAGRTMPAAMTPPKMKQEPGIATDKTSTPQPIVRSNPPMPTFDQPVIALGVPSLEPVFAELTAGQQVGEYVIER